MEHVLPALRSTARVAAMGLLFILAGCALLDPYPTRPPRPWQGPNAPPTLPDALAYSSTAKENLRGMLKENAELRSSLGVGLIPLGAAALGLGVTGGSTVAVTVLGLTGASAYGIGTWLQNGPRERAYVLGYNAIQCAEDLSIPLSGDPTLRAAAEGALQQIDEHVTTADVAVAAVEREIRAGQASSTSVKLAEDSVSAARSTLATALAARTRGAALLQDTHQAGLRLVSAVDRVMGQVDELIQKNQTDISALLTIVGGLGNVYGGLTAVPATMRNEPSKVTQPRTEAQAGPRLPPTDAPLLDAVRALDIAVSAVAGDTRRLLDFVNPIVAGKPTKAIEICGVSEDALTTDLGVEPIAGLQFTRKKAESLTFKVTGGRKPFGATIASGATDAFSVSPIVPFERDFVVRYTGADAQSLPTILAMDGSGRTTAVPISFAADAADTNDEGTNLKSLPPDPVFQDLAPEDRTKLQRALCLSGDHIDGRWGPRTREKLVAYQATIPETADGVLTITQAKKLLDADDASVSQRCGLRDPS